jgi:hypothetical protein
MEELFEKDEKDSWDEGDYEWDATRLLSTKGTARSAARVRVGVQAPVLCSCVRAFPQVPTTRRSRAK